MDSDEDAPPPPPPSSPPPGGEDENAAISKSEKFKALQGMLSSMPTMYSSPKDQQSERAAPPPSKKAHKELENESNSLAEDSPRLKHTTKERPRRKVRPPSRKSKSARVANEPKQPHELDESMTIDVVPPNLPPPPPPLSDLPPEMSDNENETDGPPVVEISSIPISYGPPLTVSPSAVEPVNKSPSSSPLISGGSYSPQTTAYTDTLKVKSIAESSQVSGESLDSRNQVTVPKVPEEQKTTPPLSSVLSSKPTVTDSPHSNRGIVIGSFSERLKKIRENRSTKRGSPSLKTSVSLTSATEKLNTSRQTSLTDVMTTPSSLTTSLTTSPALSTRSTSSSLSYGGESTPSTSTLLQTAPLSSNVDAFGESLASTITDTTLDAPKVQNGPESTVESSVPTSSLEVDALTVVSVEAQKLQDDTHTDTDLMQSSMKSDNSASHGMETSEETQNDQITISHQPTPPHVLKSSLVLEIPPIEGEDDEVPTAPPPPIPDLPPPPDDIPLDFNSEELVDVSSDGGEPSATKEVAKETKVTTKSSFRTIRKKEEWTRKAEALDSVMFDPLPLLVSNKSSTSRHPGVLPEEGKNPWQKGHDNQQTIEEEEEDMELLTKDDILHGSTESLPSLPESPPPQLPDGPPPDLPSSFPPDGIDFESNALEEIIISETPLNPPLDYHDEDKNETLNASPLPQVATNAPAIEVIDKHLEHEPSSHSASSPDATPPLGKVTPETKYSDKVQLRKPKRVTNGTSPQTAGLYRRSAFDALVSVEPSAEEKIEPKLSPYMRRSLALEASRRSDADTSPFLERWNLGTLAPSTELEREKENQSSSEGIEKNSEGMTGGLLKDGDSPKTEEVVVEATSKLDSDGEQARHLMKPLSSDESSTARPRSVADISDLKPHPRRVKDDDSRWSLPPDSDVFQKVELVSKGESLPMSNNLNLTNVTKQKWKNTDLLTAIASTTLSVSTGELFRTAKDRQQDVGDNSKAGKSNSSRSLNSSSESLPPFIGSRKSPKKQWHQRGISPLAAAMSMASTSSKEEQTTQTNNDESTDTRHSPEQISYAEKLQVQSRASERKRRSLILNEDDQIPTSFENHSQEDDLPLRVPLRSKRNLKNLQLASVQADSRALDSPRPASLVLDRDILKNHPGASCEHLKINWLKTTDPSKWSIDEVCQWLELIGLGAFRQAFRDRGVDGTLLLQIDMQLFDELGVDSHEIREVFLAKIYELSNPRFSVGGMEDDFRLAVDDYTSEDWKKFQAAVSVLKSPILGDSVELEPSAIGEYIHTEYVRSHSTPNISKIIDLQDDTADQPGRLHTSPGRHFVFPSPIESDPLTPHAGNYPGSISLVAAHNRWRRKSEPFSTPILGVDLALNETSGDERLAEWVAELPESSQGRSRALTAPSRGPMHRVRKSSDSEVAIPQPQQTLPRDVKLDVGATPDHDGGTVKEEPITTTELPSPSVKTPKKEKRHSKQQSSSPVVSETSVTLGPPGLIRLHMDTIQKGTHYKSFVADTSTTAEQLVMLALEKIDIGTNEHKNFVIVEKTVGTNGQPQRKAIKPSQPVLSLQSRWPQEEGYCFELRRKRLPQQNKGETPQHSANAASSTTTEPGDKTDGNKSPQPLQDQANLQKELDSIKLQLQTKEGLEEKLKSVQEENANLTAKLETLKQNQHSSSAELQGKLDTLNLEKQKLEDQVSMLKAASMKAGDQYEGPLEHKKGPAQLLEQVQSRYETEVRGLTAELREKERQQQEMNLKINEMEGNAIELKEKSEQLKRNTRLLGERNQQIHSLEKDLAIKEEALQKLRVQLEDAQLSADQMLSYHKTLQAMEATSKQQQEYTNRTIRDLKEQLSRATIENSQQEQLAQAVRKERDRLLREQQAKDALVASLEADLNSYRMLSSASPTESSRIQALQQSLSVHEVAIASLRGEYQRQSGELKLAEEEVSRLRKSLAKKEQQLFLLSEEPSRSSFFDLLSDLPPHTLATAEVPASPSVQQGDSREGSERSKEAVSREADGGDSTIKVMSAPGAARVSGSVVVSVPKQLQGCGIQPRDWLLEINGTNVATKSFRETNKLLLHHHQAGTTMKIVVARPLDSLRHEESGLSQPDEGTQRRDSAERYQKLNASLKAKLDFQSAEVDHWKQECERLKDEILRNFTAQKDKDSELKYLQAALQDLKYQLDDSEKARSWLQEAVGNASHLNASETEARYKKMEKELKKMKSAEKARVAELKKLQQGKDKAIQLLKQHMISSSDLQEAMSDYSAPPEELSLSKASRSELVKRLRNVEEDFSRHKVYLDQLLTVIIDQHPELLSMLGEVQRLRDEMEADTDSWC